MWAQKKYLKSDHHIPPFCAEKLSSFVVIDCHRRELLELWYGVPALTEAKKVKPRGDNFFKFSPGFENAPLTIDRKYLHSRSCLVHIFHGSSWPLLQMHLLRLFSCRALSIGKTKKMLPVLQICYTNWNFSYYQIFKPECLSFVGVKYKGVFLLDLIQFFYLVYYFEYSIYYRLGTVLNIFFVIANITISV